MHPILLHRAHRVYCQRKYSQSIRSRVSGCPFKWIWRRIPAMNASPAPVVSTGYNRFHAYMCHSAIKDSKRTIFTGRDEYDGNPIGHQLGDSVFNRFCLSKEKSSSSVNFNISACLTNDMIVLRQSLFTFPPQRTDICVK